MKISSILIILSLSTLLQVESICAPKPNNPVYPFLGGPQAPPTAAATLPPLPPSSSPPTTSSVSVASSPSPLSLEMENLVKGFCTHTDSPDLCLTSVKPYVFLINGKPLDAAAVLELHIKACSVKSQAALDASSKIANDVKTEKMTAAILQTCIDNYGDAVDNLDSAVKALKAKDIPTLNAMLSAAMTDFATCEDGFVETPGIKSPLVEYDGVLSKLASNCLALAELVK